MQNAAVLPRTLERAGPSSSPLAILWDIARRLIVVTFIMASILTLVFFPWDSDAPLTPQEQANLRRYYAQAYDSTAKPDTEEDTRYVKMAEAQAQKFQVKEILAGFASQFHLQDKRVLDIGSGRGYLQDVVRDYTGLDISPSVRRFYHKPIVIASATLMPFETNSFDAAWSIWVLEHVPNPEAALAEMRRVVKNDGLLFLAPAWDCPPYLAQGYPARPYSDFGIGGRLIKATIPVRNYFSATAKAPIRLMRSGAAAFGPTGFRYRRLTPNYDHYWVEDSDAVNTLDRHEMALWFRSRGDECLNCSGPLGGWLQENDALIIRIHKN